jgi:hypothetical protein
LQIDTPMNPQFTALSRVTSGGLGSDEPLRSGHGRSR